MISFTKLHTRRVHGLASDLYLQLQHRDGPLAQALARLNTLCLQGRWPLNGDNGDRSLLLQACTGPASATRLLQAHGMTCWPAQFGQSPYGEVFGVIRQALAGLALMRGANQVERDLWGLLVPRLAPPAARSRHALDERGRQRRYARLLHAMREAALLTEGEADATLRLLLRAHPLDRATTPPACEATAHFGGNLRVLQRACEVRRIAAERLRMLEACA